MGIRPAKKMVTIQQTVDAVAAAPQEQTKRMGLTRVTVQVSDLAKKETPFEALFLVDTGAFDCMAPGDKLRAAGIEVKGKQPYETATGEHVEFEYGFAWLSFLGDETISRIIFGPPNTEPLLGVLALESVGVIVDPKTQTLKRLHVLPLK